MKKRIALLTTGGTIASVDMEGRLAPGMRAKDILKRAPWLDSQADIFARDVFSLDSSNIQPEEWTQLADAVREAAQSADGVLITHGTDTMAYSTAALSFLLSDLDTPVVVTGSQLPLLHPLSDAPANLYEALSCALSAPAGVYIAFHHKLICGARAVKLRTTDFDAFDSVNAPLAGVVDSDGVHILRSALPRGKRRDGLDARVFLLKLAPGTPPEALDWVADSGQKGLVLEAFGLGGLHYIRRNLVDKLASLSARGVKTLVTTQCLYEKTDFSLYEVGKNILSESVFSGRDMTTEAAVAKLMWVLADWEERKGLLLENVCGEMTV